MTAASSGPRIDPFAPSMRHGDPFAPAAPAVAATCAPVLLSGAVQAHGAPANPAPPYERHRALHGAPIPRRRRDRHRLRSALAPLQQAGIRGRGGAGFPFALKLEATAAARGRPLVVVNAAEGEPGSAKDLVLLTAAPHLVLDGAIGAARVLGAAEVVVWLHHGSAALPALRHAIAERAAIDDDVRIRVAQAPDRFVAGQVTSVVRGLSGGPALPATLRVQPSERGVDGRPTLVSNAETFAQAATVWQHGPQVAGTLLATVMDEHGRRTVVECVRGTPVDRVLAAGGVDAGDRPVLVGGYAGSWLTADERGRAVVDERLLDGERIRLGVALFAVAPQGSCPVAVSAALVTWLAGQSAGQCGPCTFGLPATAGALARIAAGRPQPEDRERLARWLPQLVGRGACAHPDGVVGLVRSTGEAFSEHLWAHLAGDPCPGVLVLPAWPAVDARMVAS